MKLLKIISVLLVGVFVMFTPACKTDFDDINYYDGDADFKRIVSVGGSHMAGYSDKALYLEAQSNSIPAIIASRLAFVNGGVFNQPLVNPGVGIGISGNAKYVLMEVANPCITGTILLPEPIAATGDISNYAWIGNQVAYNNLAVPNTRIDDLTKQLFGYPDSSVGNLLYARFASEPGTSTISGDALLLNPTFVMVWLGMEDIYNYARKGGEEGGDSITTHGVFNTRYCNLINELTSLDARGVVMNIPAIENIPFFTTFPYDGLVLSADEANALNLLYSGVDSTISFVAGPNPFVIADSEVPTGRRLIKPGEYILLNVSRDSINCQKWGRTVPIPEKYVLDEDEVNDINTAIINYNNSISACAQAKGLALADMNKFYGTLKSGIQFNNANYSTQYLEGGAFSTDGYHPSQRGAALMANEIISSINQYFGAKIPLADVNAYSGIIIP